MSPDAVDANAPGYDEVLVELKARVRQARYVAQRRVNTELVQLYWQLGTTLAEQTEQQAWGVASSSAWPTTSVQSSPR
jgi:hypothetical protein